MNSDNAIRTTSHSGQTRAVDGRYSSFLSVPNRPLFIGGCPRSGTTLLRTMLHAGSELAIPRETRFVIGAWMHRRTFGDLRDRENRQRLAKWILRPKRRVTKRLGLDREELFERLVAAPPVLAAILATCFRMFAEKEGKPRWGDKRPQYASAMSCVWDLFPASQFVNVVRDPRACVASIREVGWFSGDIVPMVALWERSIAGVDAHRGRLAQDQLLDVRYEDLVQDPEPTLRRVARFGGLSTADPDIEAMLRFQQVREWRSERFHANVARPLDPSRLSRWRTTLDVSDIAFIEQATRRQMERWGYEPSTAGVSVSPDLRARLEWQRARAVVTKSKLFVREELRKRLLYRHPIALIPSTDGSPPDARQRPGE